MHSQIIAENTFSYK